VHRRSGPVAAVGHEQTPPAAARRAQPRLQESLDTLSGFLQPFLDATPRDLEDAMPPLERARAHVTLARAAVLLARLRLRLRGEALEEGHPLRKEQVHNSIPTRRRQRPGEGPGAHRATHQLLVAHVGHVPRCSFAPHLPN
jgi:hypothetical protein